MRRVWLKSVMKERRSRATNATHCGRWKDLNISALTLHIWKKGPGFEGVWAQAHPFVGLGRRPVSEAHEVEFEVCLKIFKSKPCGGLRRRAVSGAHAVELEVCLKIFKSKTGKLGLASAPLRRRAVSEAHEFEFEFEFEFKDQI